MRISPRHFRTKRIIFSTLVLALGAVIWTVVGPARLGGSATYVMVHGTSMEPKIHGGDLVVVRQGDDVRIGDIVAYRSRDLGVTVLHRLVGIKDGAYKFKGDNNGWVDHDNVTKADLVGESWVRVPHGGYVLRWTRSPSHAPLLTIPAALLLLGGFRKRSRRKIRSTKKSRLSALKALRLPTPRRPAKHLMLKTSQRTKRPRPALPSLPSIPAPDAALIHGPVGQTLLVVVCLCATASLFLGFLAFGRPASLSDARSIAYKHEGSFSYSAAANKGFVYDAGNAHTGQPVFLRLSRAVDFGFKYVFEPEARAQVSGRARLTAVVKDTNGWRRTIPLGPNKRFRGDRVQLRGRLDLAGLNALIKRVESATGVLRAGYQVAITPHIDIAGVASGRGFADHFAPELQFQLDSLQLAPVPAVAAGDGSADPLHPTTSGSLESNGTAAGTIRLFTARVEVRSARRIALVGGFLALLGAFALALLAFRGRKVSEAERIKARHGWSLIPVTASTSATGRASVKLDSIGALVRLAERRDEAVLHVAGEGSDSYFFEEGGIVYWFRTPSSADDIPPLGELPLLPVKKNGDGNGNGHHRNGVTHRSKVLKGRM